MDQPPVGNGSGGGAVLACALINYRKGGANRAGKSESPLPRDTRLSGHATALMRIAGLARCASHSAIFASAEPNLTILDETASRSRGSRGRVRLPISIARAHDNAIR